MLSVVVVVVVVDVVGLLLH